MKRVLVTGAFDGSGSLPLRFLQEASKLGKVTLALWSDAAVARINGSAPKLSLAERTYYFEALKYVDRVVAASDDCEADKPTVDFSGEDEVTWVTCAAIGAKPEGPSEAKREWCRAKAWIFCELPASALAGFPYEAPPASERRPAGMKRVIVTGCFDWLHSGHIRFFEEASEYGELNVVIGSDANVRLLKGEGHPLFSEAERSYQVGSFRAVGRCLVSTGSGWLDAEPEIESLGIERYVVNEDGDKIEKRRYCEEHGIEYIVLKRVPKEGLPRRSSTDLRGF